MDRLSDLPSGLWSFSQKLSHSVVEDGQSKSIATAIGETAGSFFEKYQCWRQDYRCWLSIVYYRSDRSTSITFSFIHMLPMLNHGCMHNNTSFATKSVAVSVMHVISVFYEQESAIFVLIQLSRDVFLNRKKTDEQEEHWCSEKYISIKLHRYPFSLKDNRISRTNICTALQLKVNRYVKKTFLHPRSWVTCPMVIHAVLTRRQKRLQYLEK